MSTSWGDASPRSTLERAVFRWALIDRTERLALLPALTLMVAWLVYTRLYFFLHPRGLTFDPSLFMYLTGKPDPTCGLTRTFAWTWRGDLAQAVHVYPLGPLLFLISAAVVVLLGVAVFTGHRLCISLPRSFWRILIAVSVVAVAVNWTAKLIWLGM